MKSLSLANRLGILAAAVTLAWPVLTSLACASAQVSMFKRADLQHPSQSNINKLVCMGQEEAARLYLQDHAYDWLGPNREGYMVDALSLRFRGGCNCPGKTCEEKALAAQQKN